MPLEEYNEVLALGFPGAKNRLEFCTGGVCHYEHVVKPFFVLSFLLRSEYKAKDSKYVKCCSLFLRSLLSNNRIREPGAGGTFPEYESTSETSGRPPTA